MNIYLIIAGMILCIFFSAFFSAAEMAFSSCNVLRLENERDGGNRKAGLAVRITEKFDDALSAILIGNNLVNIASSSLCSILVILLTGSDELTWVGTLVVTILVIIFGETIPKIVAKKSANTFAIGQAPFVHLLMVILSPLIRLIVGLISLLTSHLKGEVPGDDEAVEELQSIIDTAKDEDVLDEEASELVKAAIDFQDIAASDVMTARVDMEAIDIDDDWDDILEDIRSASHTRIPVYEESIDNIIGILHMNHFLKAMTEGTPVDIRSLLLKPCYIYKTTKLPDVLSRLRQSNVHLAVVTDEYGGTMGIISMEDVLEQIVGEIWDETDTIVEDAVKLDDGQYIIDGDMLISDFLELVGVNEDAIDVESDTVGGWTLERFGTFPLPEDTVTCDGFKITVLSMDGRRVDKVLIRPLEDEDQAGDKDKE